MRTTLLETPVPLHQWEQEFEGLLAIYCEHSPKATLEIGTYDGGSYYHWLRNAPEGALVVSCDLYDTPRDREYDDCPYDASHDNRKLYGTWKTRPGVRRRVVAGDSRSAKTKHALNRLGPFDFCFIDGDHTYDGARSDFDLCAAITRKGGIIALHDIVPPPQPVPWMQVDRLWREIKESGAVTRELVQRSYQTWGGIGLVYL